MSVIRLANFADGQVSSISIESFIPEWADISTEMTFDIFMYPLDATAGNVNLTIRYAEITSTFVFDGTAAEVTGSMISAVPGVMKQRFTLTGDFDLSVFPPGTKFMVSVERDATAGNPLDTYGNGVVLTLAQEVWSRKRYG